MGQFGETTEQVAQARTRTPKTVLGFFAIVLGIVAMSAAGVIAAIVGTPALHGLIVPILLFAGVLIVAVLVGVFLTAWRDPTVLMLGEVTGETFVEHRRLTLGDSTRGDQEEVFQIEPVTPLLEATTEDAAAGDQSE